MPKRETVDREITVRGETYRVSTTPLHVTRQLRLAPKIARIVAPMLAHLPKGVSLKELVLHKSLSDVGPALEAMMDHLDDAAVDKISGELLSSTSIVTAGDDGQMRSYDLTSQSMIDSAFQGDLELMIAVMRFAGEVNFGRYFFGRGRPAKETPTPSA